MKCLLFGLPLAAALLLGGCGSEPTAPTPAVSVPTVPTPAAVPVSDELDAAIREASNYLNGNVPKGSKILILNIQSASAALSDYILDELTANAVNDRVFSVVDRQQLSLIRTELEFQSSGNVDDDSAQEIGKMTGAQTIVSGAVSQYGETYRLRIRALAVLTAQVQGQFNRNIPKGPTITALMNSQSTPYGTGGSQGGAAQITPPAAPGGAPAQNPAQTPAQTPPKPTPQISAPTPPAPAVSPASPPAAPARPGTSSPAGLGQAPAAKQDQPGLYAGDTFQGDMDLYEALDWITLNAQNGGNYTIVLGKDQAITPTELTYDRKTVTITLKSTGNSKRTVKFEGNSPAYSLFIVSPGVTFVLEEGVTLSGTQNDAVKSLVEVAGGRFIMNGGVITGNKTRGDGGGVYVKSGTFTMNKGSITGNTASGRYGGGVYIESGSFTMNDGDISGNTASHSGNGSGGGVAVSSGTFYMAGGAISGNTASGNGSGMGTWGGGGGVYINGTFTMSGGTISGNTSRGQGGGVQSRNFTMSGGTINGNTSSGEGGGGVYVYSDTFTMTGGTISSNTSRGQGGGVYVNYSGTFTKSGTAGIIYGSNASEEQANKATDDSKGHAVYANSKKRNTTARVTTAMDSKKDGPAGGWE